MQQLNGINYNNDTSHLTNYVNRRNSLPEHARYTANIVPVFKGKNIYTESEHPSTSNRNLVYKGNDRNYLLPTPHAGNLQRINVPQPVTSFTTTQIRSHERANANVGEILTNNVPKRNSMMTVQTYTAVGTSSNTNINTSKQQKTEDASSEMKRFGSSPGEKLCIFTGTVEKLIQWNKILTQNLCYYEVIATMVSLREGTVRTQKIMLLRNRSGPILQVVYYTTTHIDLDDFYLNQIVRCVGYMAGHNILNAFSIRGATQEEIDNLERFTLISDQAVALKNK